MKRRGRSNSVLALLGGAAVVGLAAVAIKGKAKAQTNALPTDGSAAILRDANTALAELSPTYTADQLRN